MKLKLLIKELNKYKKHGDIPVIYIYGDHKEMSYVAIDRVDLFFINERIDIIENKLSPSDFMNLLDTDISKEQKDGYKPYIILSENLDEY